jgi:hypothetical protein
VTPKGTSLSENTSFEPSTITVGSAVWAIAPSKEQEKNKEKIKTNFPMIWVFYGFGPCTSIQTKFCRGSPVRMEMTHAKFGGSGFIGLEVAGGTNFRLSL